MYHPNPFTACTHVSRLLAKGSVILSLCLVMAAGGCGGRAGVVGKPAEAPARKLIVLPKAADHPSQKPYKVNGRTYYPLPGAEGFVQYGKGSWYGPKFHGRPTSSGEIFDMYKKTAAHKTLPLGTYVEVLNLSNGRKVVLRINDRGPFVKGRIIDLSRAAADEIGLIRPGVAEVRIVAMAEEVGTLATAAGKKPVVEVQELKKGEFTVQVGAFKSRENALRLADRLKVLLEYVEVSVYEDMEKGRLFRVRASKSKNLAEAEKREEELEKIGFDEAFIVSL